MAHQPFLSFCILNGNNSGIQEAEVWRCYSWHLYSLARERGTVPHTWDLSMVPLLLGLFTEDSTLIVQRAYAYALYWSKCHPSKRILIKTGLGDWEWAGEFLLLNGSRGWRCNLQNFSRSFNDMIVTYRPQNCVSLWMQLWVNL